MLLDGVNGELKNAAEKSDWMTLMKGPAQKEQMIHQALVNPQFLALTGCGPALTNCPGVTWQGSFVDANGDLTVHLRRADERQGGREGGSTWNEWWGVGD